MSSREDCLKRLTHKDQGLELKERVYYTLTDSEVLQAVRNSKAISRIIAVLKDKGLLTDEEIDDILLDCAR